MYYFNSVLNYTLLPKYIINPAYKEIELKSVGQHHRTSGARIQM
jgi:hypothetical protein